MKTKIMLVAVFVAVLLAASFAVAEDVSVSDDISGDVSVNADSSIYGLKLGWEKVGLWFTFNQEKKAQREIALANKRLVEARIMAERGNEKGFARAQEAHEKLLERAQARLEAIDEDSREDRIKASVRTVNGLQVAIEVHEAKIVSLKEKLASGNLTDQQKESIEALIDKMEAKNDAFRAKIEAKKEKAKTRLMAVGNLSEDEAEDEIEKLDNETRVTEVEKKLAERRIEKAKEAISKIKEKLAKLKEKGINVSAAEASVAEFEADIADAQAAFDAGNYAQALVEIKTVSNYGRQNSAIVKVIVQARQDTKDQIRAEVGDRIKARVGAESSEDASADVNVNSDGVRVQAGTGDVVAINP